MNLTLNDLLNSYDGIEIPFLQRNYVHGANTSRAEEIRRHFLDEFVKVLQDGKTFNLNFIYGEERNGKFIPVDGQQRLTTLWLLTAFIVNRYCKQEKESWRNLLGRFGYAGRPIAAFASHLISYGATSIQLRNSCLCSDITTEAMTRTLETIESYAPIFDNHLNSIMDALNRVVFKLESIDQDANKTYIKMNARGKTLTQWENFKGKFSELLSDKETIKTWNEQIENATNKYIEHHSKNDNLLDIIPDDSFFSLVARILFYEAFKSSNKNDITTDDFPNISSLIGYNFPIPSKEPKMTDSSSQKPLPFVPFDEFRKITNKIKNNNTERSLDTIAKMFLSFLLNVVQVQSDFFSCNYYPYWQEGNKTLWDTILKPSSDSERYFGLVLYEYVNYDQFGEKLHLHPKAIRLITNIVENTSEKCIQHCMDFFINGPDLYGNTYSDPKGVWQVAEEIQKGYIYANPGDFDLKDLQRLEDSLHGRIRIAILDLQNKIKDVTFNNSIEYYASLVKRIENVQSVLVKWNNVTDDKQRAKMLFGEIVPRLDWNNTHDVPLNFKPIGLVDLIRSDIDSCLQRTIADGNAPIDFPKNEISENRRDWRSVLLTQDEHAQRNHTTCGND